PSARALASPSLAGSIPTIAFGSRTGDRSSLYNRSVPMLPDPTMAQGTVIECSSSAVAASRVDAQEPVVDLPLDIEDAPGQLVGRPCDGREVRHGPVPAAEDLVPVPRRVEEVDGLPPADPMAGRAEVDRHVVHGEDVTGVQQVVPVVEVEREVVQLAVRTLDDGEIVDRLTAVHPRADQLGVGRVGDRPLRRPEVEALHEEPLDGRRVLSGNESMVEPRDANAPAVTGPGVGIQRAGVSSDVLRLAVQLERLLRGKLDSHPVADRQVLALAHPADGGAERCRPTFEVRQVVFRFALVAELDEPDSALLEDEGVVVVLV